MSFDQFHLAKATEADVAKVGEVLSQCKQIRLNHAETNHGKSKDKSFRFIARIDAAALYHPEWSKYFDIGADAHERKKNILRFLEIHPEFKVVDKL